ncbi:MAG: hypothetical protein WCB92_32615 [Mycobacterium sp.]
MLKLSQGEFVTVAVVESVFATSQLIRQIYVYGSSVQSFLLAGSRRGGDRRSRR